jgi:outer membrane protein, heavy metal efflux system
MIGRTTLSIGALVAITQLLGGCVVVPRDAGFDTVQASATERTGFAVRWNRKAGDQRAARLALDELLAKPLTVEGAVAIALLNNRRLQATYEELGVAQAEVVQAGLLANPLLDGDVKFPEGGGGTKVELSITQNFLDLFLIPLRKKVAEAEFETTKLRVTAEVIAAVAQARETLLEYQAAEQTLEMRRSVAAATEASYDLAQRLRAAGNNTDLDLAQERALYEQAKIDLATAEVEVLDARERVNVALGLWGTDTRWTAAHRLPEIPESDDQALEDVERRAVQSSIDLLIARQQVEATAQRFGIRRSFGLFPEAELGVAFEREPDGAHEIGPAFALPIPLFDQGQAATAAARAELERARQEFYATAVEVRSAARSTRNRLLAARAKANYYRQVILPLRRDITERTQLQYNAMQIGAFQLLLAKQDEIEAGVAYINALRDYWLARSSVEQISSGRSLLPERSSMNTNTNAATERGRNSGGH